MAHLQGGGPFFFLPRLFEGVFALWHNRAYCVIPRYGDLVFRFPGLGFYTIP